MIILITFIQKYSTVPFSHPILTITTHDMMLGGVKPIPQFFCIPSLISKLQGTHALMVGSLTLEELERAKGKGPAWYRSKKPLPLAHPFVGGGYLSNKKWPLNEGMLISYTT